MAQFTAKDLTKEPPRSPLVRVGGFSIIARTIDKCRANIAGTAGEYHFNCPLDKYLFDFMGIDAVKFKTFVGEGHTDEEAAQWVKVNGVQKTQEEIVQWSDTQDQSTYHTNPNPEKKEWFDGECAKLGLDPEVTSLFQYLDADDKATFQA